MLCILLYKVSCRFISVVIAYDAARLGCPEKLNNILKYYFENMLLEHFSQNTDNYFAK